MNLIWLAIGFGVVVSGLVFWVNRVISKEWVINLRLAKNKLDELGFKSEAPGEEARIDGDKVVLSFADDEKDYVNEPLLNFDAIAFGDQITLYVHKSGNIAFMTTKKDIKVSSFVFEK